MTHIQKKELVQVWRSPCLPQLELMTATYITHRFPRHAHNGFAIGVVESGQLGFDYRGAHVVAGRGMINLANAGEVHNGNAMTEEGWSYRMFYFENAALTDAASQMAGREANLPRFQDGVLDNVRLATALWQLHVALEKRSIQSLQAQSCFLLAMHLLIENHADNRPDENSPAACRHRIREICDLMRDGFSMDWSLESLAERAYLSPWHFLRLFQRETGMPPHQYLIQYRIQKAKELIRKNHSIVQTALETGFSDQSHLTRHFKRIVGTTPGQYSKIVQEFQDQATYFGQ